MGRIGDGYGSEYHLKHYLEHRRDELDEAVRNVAGCGDIRWLFPTDGAREFKGLDFLPTESLRLADWCAFWPQRGNPPNWDAVAQIETETGQAWMLVEAKAHVEELQSSCQASEKGGLPLIRQALAHTKNALGVAETCDWLSPYYQYCNRLAVLNFLLERQEPACLLFIYFTGDEFPDHGFYCPPDAAAWAGLLDEMGRAVGLAGNHPIQKHILKVFMPVNG